jgi:hypothetical protein
MLEWGGSGTRNCDKNGRGRASSRASWARSAFIINRIFNLFNLFKIINVFISTLFVLLYPAEGL